MAKKWLVSLTILVFFGQMAFSSVALTQPKESSGASNRGTVRVTNAGFKKLEGSAIASALENLLPSVIAAGFMSYEWIEIRSPRDEAGDLSPTASEQGAGGRPANPVNLQGVFALEG